MCKKIPKWDDSLKTSIVKNLMGLEGLTPFASNLICPNKTCLDRE